jgi:hypothetical protein
MSAVMEKLREYDRKGVSNTCLIDPRLEIMSVYRHPNLHQVEGDVIATADERVSLTRDEIFRR